MESYTINVVDESGAPMQGVFLKMINSSTNEELPSYCVTDEDGKAEFKAEADGYYIEIVSANGYSYEDRYELPEGTTELTINLEKITDEA